MTFRHPIGLSSKYYLYQSIHRIGTSPFAVLASRQRMAGLILPILLSGCVHSAAIFRQIKNDPAEWDITISNPAYGTLHAHRNFPAGWLPPVPAQRRIASSTNLPVMPPQVFGWEWVAMPVTNGPAK